MIDATLPQPGLAVIHSNKLERLRDLLVHWMQQQPVRPLGREHILVQSNGIAQWLKMGLAQRANAGIAAGLQVELPNQFVWQLYRAALGPDVPTSLPYDKINLSWRLLHVLPSLTAPVFAPLAHYCSDDPDGRKSWHLAARLADLFDQYQVYRADWLQAWHDGQDIIVRTDGEQIPLAEHDRWQPALWRAIRADLTQRAAPTQFSSRADIHQRALQALRTNALAATEHLPDRVLVFGISSLPRQTLELLAELGRHRQVLLAVMNPCRHFWGDITAVKDEVRRRQRRQQRKPGLPESLNLEDLHLHAPPLLASWGKQGRDYISLLDEFDHIEAYRDWFQGGIDLFDDDQPTHLLSQLQHDIRELNPLPMAPRRLQDSDDSIRFHCAHSRQREVEILQDELISAFHQDPTLQPRDIIIMVPDISDYAPHIHAVFGRIARKDLRYLPYSLADQPLRGHDPLVNALEYLLHLPEARATLNDLLDLMEVPAIQERFGIATQALPALRQWLSEAGVRWGLNTGHRVDLGLGDTGDAYSWLQGIQRLLLGYAMGDSSHWQGLMAYPDVGGLAAAELGPVIALVRELQHWYPLLQANRSVNEWILTLQGENGVLNRFFRAKEDTELRIMTRLQDALAAVNQGADAGQYSGNISLAVLRDAWLGQVDQAGLSQRFLAGSLTFSTLLPMRSIPFRRIYLLGMNDTDYPRSRRPDDFDLMARDYRAGDRSRRDDDRYLFLEALLSARDAFSVSWIGSHERDNSELPPSVLVNQLRDVLNQGWLTATDQPAGTAMTRHHPLQPFSTRYFDGTHTTWAHEWEIRPHATDTVRGDVTPTKPLNPGPSTPILRLRQLEDFIHHPIRHYLYQRLNVRFRPLDTLLADDEPFQLDRLQHYVLASGILQRWQTEPHVTVQDWVTELQAANQLPLAGVGAQIRKTLQHEVSTVINHIPAQLSRLENPVVQPVELSLNNVLIRDQLTVWWHCQERPVQLLLRPGALFEKQQPRIDTLRRAWLRQCIANAQGIPLTTWQCGLDAALCIPVYDPAESQALLTAWLEAYQQGLQQPLPVLPKTALAWLRQNPTAENDEQSWEDAARLHYEGGYRNVGECSDESLRYYPDFDALLAAGFTYWARQVYGPLADTPWKRLGQTVEEDT